MMFLLRRPPLQRTDVVPVSPADIVGHPAGFGYIDLSAANLASLMDAPGPRRILSDGQRQWRRHLILLPAYGNLSDVYTQAQTSAVPRSELHAGEEGEQHDQRS